MDTLALNRSGHIDAVIDEQRHTSPLRHLVQAFSNGDQFVSGAGLIAELDASDAAGDGILDHLDEVARPEDLGC
jgi:hypothetical protein